MSTNMNAVRQVDRVDESAGVSSAERSTPWRLVKGRVHLSLPAGAGRDAARIASKQAYGRLLFRHHPALGGVVVAHEGEVQLVSGPKYVTTSPFAHVAAETTLLLFAPCVGCILTGVITYVGPDHIGLTVHSAFHAVLPFEDVAPHYTYVRMPDSDARWQRLHSTDGPDASTMSVLDDGSAGHHKKDYVHGGRVRFVVTGVQTTRSGLYQLFGSVRGGSNSSTSVTGELGVIHKEESVIQLVEEPINQVSFGDDEPLQSVLTGLNLRKRRREREQATILAPSFSTPSRNPANPLSTNTRPLLSSSALAPPSFKPSSVGRRKPTSIKSIPLPQSASLPLRTLLPSASPALSTPSPPPPPSPPQLTQPLTQPSAPPPPRTPSPSPVTPPARPQRRPSLLVAPPTMTAPYGKADTKSEAQIELVVPFPGSTGNSQIKEEVPAQDPISAQIERSETVKETPISEKKRKKKRKADTIAGFGEVGTKASKRARSVPSSGQVHSDAGLASGQSGQAKNEDRLNSSRAAIIADAVQAVKTAFNTQTGTQDGQLQSQATPSPSKAKSKSGKSSRASKKDKTSKSRKVSKGPNNKNDGVVHKDDKEEKREHNVEPTGSAPDALAGIQLSGSHSHLKREAHEIVVPKEDDINGDDVLGSTKKNGSKEVQDDARFDTNNIDPSQVLTPKEISRKKKQKPSENSKENDQVNGSHKTKSKVKKKPKDKGGEKSAGEGDEQKKKSKSKKRKRSEEVSAVDLDRLRSLGGSSTLANAIFEDMFEAQPPS